MLRTLILLIYLIFMLQSAMRKFTQKIVQMMKEEKLFQSQGGPIILSQVAYKFLSVSTALCFLLTFFFKLY